MVINHLSTSPGSLFSGNSSLGSALPKATPLQSTAAESTTLESAALESAVRPGDIVRPGEAQEPLYDPSQPARPGASLFPAKKLLESESLAAELLPLEEQLKTVMGKDEIRRLLYLASPYKPQGGENLPFIPPGRIADIRS